MLITRKTRLNVGLFLSCMGVFKFMHGKQSIMEPLVDTVDQNQIVTNCQLLKIMDISKMAAADASFTAPFKLVAERDDYIHALVAYFDVLPSAINRWDSQEDQDHVPHIGNKLFYTLKMC